MTHWAAAQSDLSTIVVVLALTAGCGGHAASGPAPEESSPSPMPLVDAEYAATDAGTPGSSYTLSTATGGGMNENTQIVSTWSAPQLSTIGFESTVNAGFQNLGNLGAPAFNSATICAGVNGSGQIVGASGTVDGSQHAFLYTDGLMEDLGTLSGGKGSSASAIDDSGQIAGTSYIDLGYAGQHSHAVLVSAGVMRDLGTVPGASDSYGYGINASGQVVGSCLFTAGYQHAFLYSKGEMTDLITLSGGLDSYATAINAGGEIVGTATDSHRIPHAFLYTNGMMQNLESLGGASVYDSSAAAINSSGQIVGDVGKVATPSYPFLYENGTMKNLNDITSGLGSVTLYLAFSITDTGDILAEGLDAERTEHLMVLTPIRPETRSRRGVAVGLVQHRSSSPVLRTKVAP